MAKKKPGIMVYFDTLPDMERLTLEETGLLFRAMLAYGEHETPPDFSEFERLDGAWGSIRKSLDRDNEKYQKKVIDGAYSAYKKAAGKDGKEPVDFDTWYRTIYTGPGN